MIKRKILRSPMCFGVVLGSLACPILRSSVVVEWASVRGLVALIESLRWMGEALKLQHFDEWSPTPKKLEIGNLNTSTLTRFTWLSQLVPSWTGRVTWFIAWSYLFQVMGHNQSGLMADSLFFRSNRLARSGSDYIVYFALWS